MSEKGKLIVIEGLDGSGKATQSALLADHLREQGIMVFAVDFPDYKSRSSELVKMYLAGEIGKAGEVNAYAASSFYAADRYISYQTCWKKQYSAGYTILADRYTTSNAYHQMSKLPMKEWDGYIDWLWDFEFNRMGLPAPDIVVYLDMKPEISRGLLEKRYSENGRRDIHETDFRYLLSCREAALYASEKLGWRILSCDDGTEPLPVDIIAQQVRAITGA